MAWDDLIRSRKIRDVHVFGTLDTLADCWDAVAGGSSTPMQRYAWLRACAETPVAGGRLHVVAVGDVSRPAALAPLVCRPGPWRRLELLGLRTLHEPMDFVAADAPALERLADALARLGAPLMLERLHADSAAVPALRKAFRGRGVVITRPAHGWPVVTLDSGQPEPEARLDAGRRSDLRRARRIAEQLGPVTCAIESPDVASFDRLLEDALRTEAASWKGVEGSAVINDPMRGPFYRRYAAAARAEGTLRLCFLRIGDRVAAMQLAVECGQRYWLLKIGYDEAFARCSPGLLLILETLRYAAARGLRSYEFLGTPAPWIRMWTKDIHPCTSLRAYPARGPGIAALASDVARSGWRRLARLGSRGT